MTFKPHEIYYSTKYEDLLIIVDLNADGLRLIEAKDLTYGRTGRFFPTSAYANTLIYLGTDLSAVKQLYPEYFI